MLFENFNEDGELVKREIDQNTVQFEDLERESLIDLLYGLRELLVFDEDNSDDDEEADCIYEAQRLLKQYQSRSEVNCLDEFLKDTLGKDAYLFTSDGKNKIEKIVKCFDKFDNELNEDDIVDVQLAGNHKIYKKEDGQLYFKPYGKEDRVSAYFRNDLVKV